MNLAPRTAIGLKQTGVAADMLKEKKLRQACSDFEAIILRQMLSIMRKSIPKSKLLHGGFAEDMYQSMYDDMLAEKLAQGKGIGVGEALFQQLSGSVKKSAGK